MLNEQNKSLMKLSSRPSNMLLVGSVNLDQDGGAGYQSKRAEPTTAVFGANKAATNSSASKSKLNGANLYEVTRTRPLELFNEGKRLARLQQNMNSQKAGIVKTTVPVAVRRQETRNHDVVKMTLQGSSDEHGKSIN